MTGSFTSPLFDYEARIISLLGRVDEAAINLAVDLLLRLDATSSDPITVFVGSQGGNVIEGFKLVDTISLMRSPLTTVALGLVEGAGLLLLTSSQNRIVYPSAFLSTAGLWDLPIVHDSGKAGMGLHSRLNLRDQLHEMAMLRMNALVKASHGRIPGFLAEPDGPPRLFGAESAIHAGLADAIIEGSHRSLHQPKTKIITHAKSIGFQI